jgi:hypothetical protein
MVVEKSLEEEIALLAIFRILNEMGRAEARKRVSELKEINRYT